MSQKPPACAEKFLYPSGDDYQQGLREGGYNESRGGTALYLEREWMACSQNYQLSFMIIYCTAALIMHGKIGMLCLFVF